ncbi:amidohydrolase [Kineococcus sp. NPDC059986]|uniref:amidohydrolase n=1 Tax=Kineococcus sp. NPDC059986 TaxID=3155538 RepID=UPI00344FC3D9
MSGTADLVLHSGRVFTGTGLHPTATAVAVAGGRVAAVGTDGEARDWTGAGTRTVDLAGRLVLPGFTDAHVHPVMGGLERLGCDLSEVHGAQAALERVAAHAAAHPGEWISGGGWSMADFPGGTPRREDLDRVVPDRPAFLLNRDHHGAWANSRALALAGVDVRTPDPADGRIERDPDGTPTGTLHEGAMDLVSRLLPPVTRADLAAGLAEGQRYLHSVGVTGWQDAIVGAYAGHSDTTPVYLDAVSAGTLTARVVGALWWPRGRSVDEVDDVVAGFVAHRERVAAAGGDRFATTSVKIMLDGVAENRTASMLSPYLDGCGCGSGETGLSYLDRDLLLAAVPALDAAGFDVHVHVIGDRAVRDALDAVALARRSPSSRGGRHHLAHLQVVHPDDVPRFAALDVTANAQALWACEEEQMTALTTPLLGPERNSWQYPFGALLRTGARLVMGSDWPVSTPDPWQAVHVAVNRTPPGVDAPPFLPDQALTLTEALHAYTAGSAWINRHEDAGTLEPGAVADLAVASADPFSLERRDLHEVRTDLTFVAGVPVHDASAAPAADLTAVGR